MGDPTGEADTGALRLDFDHRLLLQFRGSAITSDAGLLPYRELDDAVGLTETGANTLADARTGKNGRHRLAGLLRQSIFGRLAGLAALCAATAGLADPIPAPPELMNYVNQPAHIKAVMDVIRA